jgi:hypothetical protein
MVGNTTSDGPVFSASERSVRMQSAGWRPPLPCLGDERRQDHRPDGPRCRGRQFFLSLPLPSALFELLLPEPLTQVLIAGIAQDRDQYPRLTWFELPRHLHTADHRRSG